MDAIAERIRKILELRGWSERELSTRADLSPVHVGKIIDRGGARAGVETLIRIANAAGVSFQWLATGKGAPEPDRETSALDRPMYRNLPNWAEAVTVVRKTRPWVPLYALEAAAETNALLAVGPVTPEMVLRVATMCLENIPPDRLEQLDSEAVEREIAEASERYDRALEAQRQMREQSGSAPGIVELMRLLEPAGKTDAGGRRRGGPRPANDGPTPSARRRKRKS